MEITGKLGLPWQLWSRSRTCSGVCMATTLINMLNESTQSSIVEMFIFGLALSPCSRTSSTVGPMAPRRTGNSSSSSMYSPRQIFSAGFDGMEGETGPTVTALLESGLSRKATMGVSSKNWPLFAWSPLVLVSMPASDRESGSVAIPPSCLLSPVVVLSTYQSPHLSLCSYALR